MSRGQRALWTFLFFTLVAPFFGALVAVIGSPLLMWANAGPFMAADHPPFDWANVLSDGTLMPLLAEIGIRSYVWCALPAALTALTLLPHILRKGTAGWLEAAVGGALCFAAASVVLALPHGGLLVYSCFAAAVAAVLCWAVLRWVGVLGAAEA